jgi:hypothetical protein
MCLVFTLRILTQKIFTLRERGPSPVRAILQAIEESNALDADFSKF